MQFSASVQGLVVLALVYFYSTAFLVAAVYLAMVALTVLVSPKEKKY